MPPRRGARPSRMLSAPSPSVSRHDQTGPGPARATYRCAECGWETAKWVGRCGECQAWGSVAEAAGQPQRPHRRPARSAAPAVPIGQVPVEDSASRTSGVPELDRVLGGGVVPGRGGAARRRARRRQVARCCSRSPPQTARVRAAARSTSPARSPRPRCGCAPTAPAASTTSSTSPPRPTSARCSATSRRSARSCWSSTRCRPSAPPTSTACPAASPRSRRSPPPWSGWPRPGTSPR